MKFSWLHLLRKQYYENYQYCELELLTIPVSETLSLGLHTSKTYPRFRNKESTEPQLIHFGIPTPWTLPLVSLRALFLFVVSLLVFLIFMCFDASNPTNPCR